MLEFFNPPATSKRLAHALLGFGLGGKVLSNHHHHRPHHSYYHSYSCSYHSSSTYTYLPIPTHLYHRAHTRAGTMQRVK